MLFRSRELIYHIISYLSVTDTLLLRNVSKSSRSHKHVVLECIRRLSTKTFIEEKIGRSGDILDAMSRNAVYITGSMSVEFFVPGTTIANSDINFITSHSNSRVSRFMKSMEEHTGMKWHSPMHELHKNIQSGRGTITVSGAYYETLLRDYDLMKVLQQEGLKVDESLVRYWDLEEEDEDYGLVVIEVCDTEVSIRYIYEHDIRIPGIAYVVPGSINIRGKSTPVQLMVQRQLEPITPDAIFNFHSTCVQSFIGAHVACHLYGKSASKLCTYIWLDSMKSTEQQDAAEKYLNRGFSKTNIDIHDRGFNLRTVDDEHSVLLTKLNTTMAPANVVEYYREIGRASCRERVSR